MSNSSATLLSQYVAGLRKRLQWRFTFIALLLMMICVLSLSAMLSYTLVVLIPDSSTVDLIRWIVYGGLCAGIWIIVMHEISEAEAIRFTEQREKAFGGRLVTWWDSHQRAQQTPMLALLAEAVSEVVKSKPPEGIIRRRELTIPALAAGILLTVGIFAMLAGDSPWQLAAQRVWLGETSETAPRITVSPGDIVIPRGSDVLITATASGYEPERLSLHALFENTNTWETAPLSRQTGDRFAFVFMGVTEEIEYYIGPHQGDGGVTSGRHIIRVADLPRITDVRLDYQFPGWTGLEPKEQTGGDLWALPNTTVTIHATSSKPLEDAIVVINGKLTKGESSNGTTTGHFTVTETGSWHIAVRHEGILTRISDTYLINLLDDHPPELTFEWPGRDRSATSIEEVGLRFTARDDYRIERMSVHYSVNGNSWQKAEHPVQTVSGTEQALDHVLYLEELDVSMDGSPRTLRPGDVISVYAQASDHSHSTRSSLYFVDVRPFDRVYRESEQMGGGGGGGQGFESVQRQREILTATWNLINRSEDGNVSQADADQSTELASLQRTLRTQVQTLIARAGARGLDVGDQEMQQFLVELQFAVEDMEPAAVALDRVAQDRTALEAAIEPEQKALQHLLAAEAAIGDVNVANADSGEGEGSNSLSELVELELDQERNRYETPQQPNRSQSTNSDDWRKLEELAARQEKLAQEQRNTQQPRSLSRWQQEQLKRELEQVRQRVQQQASSSQNTSSLSQALESVDDAISSMEQSLSEPPSTENTQTVSQALSTTAQRLQEAQTGALDSQLKDYQQRVESMLNQQRQVIEQLITRQASQREAEERGERTSYYDFSMLDEIENKETLREELTGLTGDISRTSDAIRAERPDASNVLRRALDRLAEDQIEARIDYVAELYDYGQPDMAGPQEFAIAETLDRLSDMLTLARDYLADAGFQAQPIDEVRRLQRALGQARAGNRYADEGAINAVEDELDQLITRLDLANSPIAEIDTSADRANYVPRGTEPGHTDALYQMLSDRLDLLENALLRSRTDPIRAQRSRDLARDSAAAAEYFRLLSEGQ